LRLLLFGATEQPLASFTRLDIAFPSQIEVRINNDEVKANYKGLKNKPGSTRPADITGQVRITPANYRNSLVVTYALTQKASQPRDVSYPFSAPMARTRTDSTSRSTISLSTW
jgi:E3 SUMO-protein ligase PIAS1